MIAKITKKLVDQVHPGPKDILVFDTDLKGFTLKVTPSGTKTYLIIYRMGGRATAKQKITIGKHGSPWTADAARTEAEKLLGQVGQMIDPAADRKASLAAAFTVAALADRYLIEHVATKNKPSTLAEVRRQVERIIKPRLGTCAVAAVTRGDIAALHHALRATPRQANHVLAVLSKMFTLAELWGFRPETTNPCRLIQRYKESKRERFLSTAEVADLAETLATLEDNRQEMDSVLNAVRLLLLTGCRLGEMLALRWEDIDLEAGTLTIRDAKAGARRHSIGAQTIALLKDLPHHSDWVLTGTSPHRPLPRATLEGAWSRIRAAANLTDVRLHDLRHTVGTYAGQTGANAFLVRDKLGHKTLAMTGRYVNRDADPLRALSDAVEDRIMTALKSGTGRRKGGDVPTG
jgi:integrase